MKNENKHLQSSLQRSKVWVSLATTTLGAIASLISAVIGTTVTLNLSNKWTIAIASAAATIALSAVFTSVLVRRESGSSRIAKLKDDMASAYLGSLKNSTLNPFQGDKR